MMYINYYGCDAVASDYVNGTANEVVDTKLGTFYLPVCWKPVAYPTFAPILFVSFILICGFILVSLTVAFVTTGINTRLHEMKQQEDKEELKAELGNRRSIKLHKKGKENKTNEEATFGSFSIQRISSSENESSPRLSIADKVQDSFEISKKIIEPSQQRKSPALDPNLLRELLKQVWIGSDMVKDESKGDDVAEDYSDTDTPRKQSKRRQRVFENSMLRIAVKCKVIVANKYYNYAIYVVVILAAMLELVSIERSTHDQKVNNIGLACQVVFSIDIILKFVSCAPRYVTFFHNSWNQFDFLLVAALWVPVALNARDSYIGKCLYLYYDYIFVCICVLIFYSIYRVIESTSNHSCVKDVDFY